MTSWKIFKNFFRIAQLQENWINETGVNLEVRVKKALSMLHKQNSDFNRKKSLKNNLPFYL